MPTQVKQCVSCNFSASTLAKGCLAILINTDSAPVVSLKISRDTSATTARDCTILSDNGYYLLTVYDWEEDGGISDEPAVTGNLMVDITRYINDTWNPCAGLTHIQYTEQHIKQAISLLYPPQLIQDQELVAVALVTVALVTVALVSNKKS